MNLFSALTPGMAADASRQYVAYTQGDSVRTAARYSWAGGAFVGLIAGVAGGIAFGYLYWERIR